MKKKIVFMTVPFILVLIMTGCGQKTDVIDNEVTSVVSKESTSEEISSTEVVTEDTPSEVAEDKIITIYDGDELINTYLNRYNDVNVSNPIDDSGFEVYHHHGSAHKDQILLKDDEFSSIVISSQVGKIKIDIEGKCDNETYKNAFIKYAKGYNSEITEDKLGEYWEQSMSNQGLYTQFDDFEVYVRTFNDSIELLEITSELH